MNTSDVFAELARRGYTRAVVHFSGGNDEGRADSTRLYAGDAWVSFNPSRAYDRWDPLQNRFIALERTPDQHLAEGLEAPIYQEYGTFAGEFYVSGTVTWDVATRTVDLEADFEADRY